QVEDGQERPLEQQRRESGEQARALPLVQRGQLLLKALRPLAVLGPELADLRREAGLDGLSAHRTQAERQQEQAHGHGEHDDRPDGREHAGERDDEMVGGVDGDAEQTGHGEAAFQLGLMIAGGGRDLARRGQRAAAAAGAADGALGLARPAASGSRCRWNAARQDRSRSAETRRTAGTPAATRDTRDSEVTSTSIAARAAPARAAAASSAGTALVNTVPISVANRPCRTASTTFQILREIG